MKLCFVASGVADHVVKWLDWFATHGHEVHLISPPYEIPFREFHPSIKVYGLKRMIPVSYKASRLWNMPYWVKQARRIMGEIKPDLVEGQYIGMPGAIATLAGYHPLILQAWGSDILLDSKDWPNSMLVKHCLSKADMLFCDSETVKAGMRELGADMRKVRIVYNGVDTKFFSPTKRVSKQRVISTRSLKSVYDVETTIRAVPLVLEHFPQAVFILCGEGEDRAGLERLAEELGVKDKVAFVGWQSPREIRDWLRLSQVCVSTSRSDSTSLCLQEAMACGLPAVVSSLSANKEWVKNGENGFLAEVGNAQEVANAIKHLLREPELRRAMGRLNRSIIVKEADLNDNMRRAEQLYLELVGGRGVAG